MKVFWFSLSCVALWKSFQQKKERLVEQLLDFESKMAAFTTAKADGLQHAEGKYQTCKVSLGPISHRGVSVTYVLLYFLKCIS